MISNLNIKKLYTWPKPVKRMLIGFLFLLISGVSIGIVYLSTTTSFSAEATIEHYNGSRIFEEDIISVPEKYPKPYSELLLTTHNHLIGFSFIFFILCGLFYFNSVISGPIKNFLLVEPFVSTWITFASIWAVRYVHSDFVYLTFIAALLTYLSLVILVLVLVYELGFKKAL